MQNVVWFYLKMQRYGSLNIWLHISKQKRQIEYHFHFPFQFFRHLSSLPPISWTLAIWRICIQMYKSKIENSLFGLFNSCYVHYVLSIYVFASKINFNVLNPKLCESVMPLKNSSHL